MKHTDDTSEVIHLVCVILRIVISWMTSPALANIGRRIELLSKAAFLPGGYVDTNGIAAAMNMEERGAEGLLHRIGTPYQKPGATRFYRLEDVTTGGNDE